MILGYGGKLSGGKTICGVRYCLEQGLKGKKIVTNVRLKFPNSIKVDYFKNDEFVQYLKDNFEDEKKLRNAFYNSVLFLDEIVNLVSGRKATTNLNEMLTNFFMMAGKLDCDVFYTFQDHESQTDKRLRNITQVYATCLRFSQDLKPLIWEKRKYKGKILIIVKAEYDFGLFGIKQVIEHFNPEPYYKFYETDQIILMNTSLYQKGGSRDITKQ